MDADSSVSEMCAPQMEASVSLSVLNKSSEQTGTSQDVAEESDREDSEHFRRFTQERMSRLDRPLTRGELGMVRGRQGRWRVDSFDSLVEVEVTGAPFLPSGKLCWRGCCQLGGVPISTPCFGWRWFVSLLLDKLFLRYWAHFNFVQLIVWLYLIHLKILVHCVYVATVADAEVGIACLLSASLTLLSSPLVLRAGFKLAADAIGILSKRNNRIEHGLLYITYRGPPGEEPYLQKFHQHTWVPLLDFLTPRCSCSLFKIWYSSRYSMDDLVLLTFYVFPMIFALSQWNHGFWAMFALSSCYASAFVYVPYLVQRTIGRAKVSFSVLKEVFCCHVVEHDDPLAGTRLQKCQSWAIIVILTMLCGALPFMLVVGFLQSGVVQTFILFLSGCAICIAVWEEWSPTIRMTESRFLRSRRQGPRSFMCWDFFYSPGAWYYVHFGAVAVLLLFLAIPSQKESSSFSDAFEEFNPIPVNSTIKATTLDPGALPGLCSLRWMEGDLGVFEMAQLAKMGYKNKAYSEEFLQYVDFGVVAVATPPAKGTQLPFMEFHSEQHNTSVLSIAGTSSAQDVLMSFQLLAESVLLNGLLTSYIMPTTSVQECVWFGIAIEWLLFPKYAVGHVMFVNIERRVRELLAQGKHIILTGHSLGAVVSQVVAIRFGLPSVVFAPPGMGYQVNKFNLPSKEVSTAAGISVIVADDVITWLGLQIGIQHVIDCEGSFAVCHKVNFYVCRMLEMCGSLRPARLMEQYCWDKYSIKAKPR